MEQKTIDKLKIILLNLNGFNQDPVAVYVRAQIEEILPPELEWGEPVWVWDENPRLKCKAMFLGFSPSTPGKIKAITKGNDKVGWWLNSEPRE